jgi:hypothetical protein
MKKSESGDWGNLKLLSLSALEFWIVSKPRLTDLGVVLNVLVDINQKFLFLLGVYFFFIALVRVAKKVWYTYES